MLDLEIIKILLFKQGEEVNEALIEDFIREYSIGLLEILIEALLDLEEERPEIKKLLEDVGVVLPESETDPLADADAPVKALQMILVTVNSDPALNEKVNQTIVEYDKSIIEEYTNKISDEQKTRLRNYFEDLDEALKTAGMSLGIHVMKQYNVIKDISEAIGDLEEDNDNNDTTSNTNTQDTASL